MPKKVSIILLFILIIVAGNLTPLFSTPDTSAEQPYQVAISRRYLNANITKLEGRVAALETEVKKLKTELEELRKGFAVIKQQQEEHNKLEHNNKGEKDQD